MSELHVQIVDGNSFYIYVKFQNLYYNVGWKGSSQRVLASGVDGVPLFKLVEVTWENSLINTYA